MVSYSSTIHNDARSNIHKDFEGWTNVKQRNPRNFRVGTRKPLTSMEDGQDYDLKHINDKRKMRHIDAFSSVMWVN